MTGWTGRSASAPGPGPRVKVLTQLPGIGPFTALVILAGAGDISRFAPARQLASWAGLTPAAFEACYGTSWLVQLLEDYGFDPHLVHPSRCKAIASARFKNDKGRRRDLGTAAAGGPAARSLDCPAAGAGAAGAAAAPGLSGAAADPAAEPDPCHRGRLRV